MFSRPLLLAAALVTLAAQPASARIGLPDRAEIDAADRPELPPYLQCVPYARQVTGIQIYGDAHTWWGQAEGRYARGFKPKVGAVLALKPSGGSTLGHVAAVSRIIDKRTILIRHSNWSPINGRRGQIEDNVKVIDVSPANDWSEVRVWYAPLQALGGSHWPVQGFIYPAPPKKGEKLLREGSRAASQAPAQVSRDPIGDIIKRKMKW
ncbi:MAG: CHAP domain-containing protein [Novosphingobium sp.]